MEKMYKYMCIEYLCAILNLWWVSTCLIKCWHKVPQNLLRTEESSGEYCNYDCSGGCHEWSKHILERLSLHLMLEHEVSCTGQWGDHSRSQYHYPGLEPQKDGLFLLPLTSLTEYLLSVQQNLGPLVMEVNIQI